VKVDELNRELHGNEIEVSGVGVFVAPSQYTVFLACDGSRLRNVWQKTDYGYNPHLTLYDGRDSAFANALKAIVTRHELPWRFRADELRLLVPSSEWFQAKSQQRMELLLRLPRRNFTADGDLSLTFADAATLSPGARLETIDRLINEASRVLQRRDPTFARQTHMRSIISAQ
jgi:hypothetical protein